MKTKHGVYLKYGKTEVKLSADELLLIAEALGTVNSDTEKQKGLARKLSVGFRALSEYVRWLRRA